jgi:hypothetical protein
MAVSPFSVLQMHRLGPLQARLRKTFGDYQP